MKRACLVVAHKQPGIVRRHGMLAEAARLIGAQRRAAPQGGVSPFAEQFGGQHALRNRGKFARTAPKGGVNFRFMFHRPGEHAGELAHASCGGVRAFNRFVIHAAGEGVGHMSAGFMGGCANGVVIFGEGNAAEIVSELRFYMARNAPWNECDAPDFSFGSACAKACEHRSVGGFETVDLTGCCKFGKNLLDGCLRGKLSRAG